MFKSSSPGSVINEKNHLGSFSYVFFFIYIHTYEILYIHICEIIYTYIIGKKSR
jgi:hypothetical protein